MNDRGQSRQAQWAALRPLKLTRRCTLKSSPGRGPRACLPAWLWKEPTLRQDLDDNATLYGKKPENREIMTKASEVPGQPHV